MNTNHIENYERIIKKVQSYGIQVAAGLILGIANTTLDTFTRSLEFFQRNSIIYVKLTFLTYNPGTKVSKYMERKGSYIAPSVDFYDGVRPSYLPHGVNLKEVIVGAEMFIKKYYSITAIFKRSGVVKTGLVARLEYILFAWCYGRVYRLWLGNNFLHEPNAFQKLLITRFEKSKGEIVAETLLHWARRQVYKQQK